MWQTDFSGNRWFICLGSIAICLILFGPLLALFTETIISQIHNPGQGISFVLPTGRRAILFLRTVGLGLSVAVSGMVVGVMIATVLWRWNKGKIRHLRWFILVFVAIPPYIHALAWSSLISPGTINGWWMTCWVQLMSFLPIATGLALVGLESVNTRLINAARMMKSDANTFRKIVLPTTMPAILIGGALLFLLSIADFSVPSLFRVNVYALEIFAEFSSTGSPADALLLSIPIIGCAFIVVIALYKSLKQVLFSSGRTNKSLLISFYWPSWVKILQIIAIVILMFQILVPLVGLISDIKSFTHLLNTISTASVEIFYSLMIAAIAALVSLPLGWLGVRLMSKERYFGLWWLLLLVPLVIPPALTGIGLISTWNHRFLPDIYDSPIILILADLSRFLPVSVLILFIMLKQINPALLDAARIVEKRPWRIISRITLPLIMPGLIVSAFVVFILSLGELGASILVAPPGRSTISMTIFNYLHYGESSTVAGLSLLMVASTLIIGMLTFLILTRKRFYKSI